MSAKREMERELLMLKAQVHRQAIRRELVDLREGAAAASPVSSLFKGAMFLIGLRSMGSKTSWLLRLLPVAVLLMRRFKKPRSADS